MASTGSEGNGLSYDIFQLEQPVKFCRTHPKAGETAVAVVVVAGVAGEAWMMTFAARIPEMLVVMAMV